MSSSGTGTYKDVTAAAQIVASLIERPTRPIFSNACAVA
jgi:hypothetical protein